MEFCCCRCEKATRQPAVCTCGHYICEACIGNLAYCPVDNCDSLGKDEEVQRQLSACIAANDPGSIQALEAYIEVKYPWKCYECQHRCRPEACYLHQPPLSTTWQCNCGFQYNSCLSPICSSCHRPKGSGQDSRSVSWYSCTCSGNKSCGFCTLKGQLQSGTWRTSSDFLPITACQRCGKGLPGLQYIYCQVCQPLQLPFRSQQF